MWSQTGHILCFTIPSKVDPLPRAHAFPTTNEHVGCSHEWKQPNRVQFELLALRTPSIPNFGAARYTGLFLFYTFFFYRYCSKREGGRKEGRKEGVGGGASTLLPGELTLEKKAGGRRNQVQIVACGCRQSVSGFILLEEGRGERERCGSGRRQMEGETRSK